MSKTTGFPGRNALSPQRGGWQGGVKNARFTGKTQFKAVKGGQFGAHFGRNRASSGAFESESREFERECDQKRPHVAQWKLIEDSCTKSASHPH